MPEERHPSYDETLVFVRQMRASMAGSKRIKEGAEEFLFRPSGYTDTEYAAYVHRAEYLPTVRRTHAGMLGRAFNEEPEIEYSGSLDLDTLDRGGLSSDRLLRWILGEVLLVNCCGLLADYDESPRVARYRREDILDWHFEDARLVWVCLDQSHTEFVDGTREQVTEHLTLRIEDGAVVSEVWRMEGDEKTARWVSQGETIPQAQGQRLTEIPFRFVGDPSSCDSVLSPIADLALDYYDRSAQHSWLLSKVASPQFTIQWDRETEVKSAQSFLETNMSTDGALHIGAGSILQLLGASAYYVEVSGNGIDKIDKAKEDIKKQMIAAGARALADQTQSNVAAETARIMNSGEAAILSEIVGSTGTDVSLFMDHVAVYAGESEAVQVYFSKNFFSEKIALSDLMQVVAAWQSGAVPLESVHAAATQAGLTEDDFDDYVEKIDTRL